MIIVSSGAYSAAHGMFVGHEAPEYPEGKVPISNLLLEWTTLLRTCFVVRPAFVQVTEFPSNCTEEQAAADFASHLS